MEKRIWHSVAEAAEILGISASKLWALKGDGLLEVDGNIRLGDGNHRNIIGPTNATLGIYSNPNDSNEGIKFSTDGGSTIEMFLRRDFRSIHMI